MEMEEEMKRTILMIGIIFSLVVGEVAADHERNPPLYDNGNKHVGYIDNIWLPCIKEAIKSYPYVYWKDKSWGVKGSFGVYTKRANKSLTPFWYIFDNCRCEMNKKGIYSKEDKFILSLEMFWVGQEHCVKKGDKP